MEWARAITSLFLRSIGWSAGVAARVALWPCLQVWRLAMFALSPLWHATSVAVAYAAGAASLTVTFKPLYSFLASAGFVGLVAGTVVYTLSAILTTALFAEPSPTRPMIDRKDFAANYADWLALSDTAMAGSDYEFAGPPRASKGLLTQVIHEEEED